MAGRDWKYDRANRAGQYRTKGGKGGKYKQFQVFGTTFFANMALGLDKASKEQLNEAEAEPIFKALSQYYRRRRRDIPKDTGALRKSLINRGDRYHAEGVSGDRLIYGSNLPQAYYVFDRVPKLDTAMLKKINNTMSALIQAKYSRWL